MKKKQSKLKMENLEAIESLLMQELTPEESDKIVGGKAEDIVHFDPGDDCGDPYNPPRPCRHKI